MTTSSTPSHWAPSGLAEEALIARFTDLHPALTKRQAFIESSRCLYCFDAPCIKACPTSIDIPTFIRRIHDDNLEGAASEILDANILGGSCARVCPTEILCEQSCVRNQGDECQPVLIGLLQRHALDNAQFEAHPFTRGASTGRRIAVVGAGPAGLSCAHRLARFGHDVVIFEAEEKAGGLNEYGIARYKLTDDFAAREVEFLLEIGGIEIRHGQRLGDNLTLASLTREFDSVFLGLGLGTSHALGLTGEDASGLMAATDFIKVLRQSGELNALAVPRHAVVIGAGNTAIDIAVQAKRLGAQTVDLVYRRGEEQMSATHHEQEIARANGVMIHTWARPLAIDVADDSDRSEEGDDAALSAMQFARTQVEDGRLVDTGETFTLACDGVFTAIGQGFDDASLSDAHAAGLAREGAKIEVDEMLRTSLPGVYAGGDCIARGQDLTVQAVAHGKLAAEAIHHDLMLKVEAA
ncbi:NAD(P)-dependent oxidoreductase [Cobetia sp. LC6]|uniref:NAD(P)-dependent oxidoreductase n=1 Tax=Cobetia sp. LC6 TaxID=3050947 RepID=UPI002553411E|nr:NAD(P)-dependent oxidoreductase [Cobetia sp. LC6]MDL2190515.1 NAD(P)-dependent oxidoreductase [Cobetia sp. LC6]